MAFSVDKRFDWSRWLPFILTILTLSGGGLATAVTLANRVAVLEDKFMREQSNRQTDHDLLLRVVEDVSWIRSMLEKKW